MREGPAAAFAEPMVTPLRKREGTRPIRITPLRESLGKDTHIHTHPETDTSTSWSEIQREISGHLAPHMSSVSAGIQAIRSKQQHMKETQLPYSLQPSSATLQIPQREMFASSL
ncbi:unnamed protein product [Leuciscus chuanchicus]